MGQHCYVSLLLEKGAQAHLGDRVVFSKKHTSAWRFLRVRRRLVDRSRAHRRERIGSDDLPAPATRCPIVLRVSAGLQMSELSASAALILSLALRTNSILS